MFNTLYFTRNCFMNNQVSMQIIARIHTDFTTKFGIPRQSGIVDSLQAYIVFEPEYRNMDALRGLEDFSHIWLIWQFSQAVRDTWSPMVRPPRLGGNAKMGVFATRSPFRPNAIGLSCVQLEQIEEHPTLGPIIHVRGADLMDGTPIFDIKPYLPLADCHPDALSGFAGSVQHHQLEVIFPDCWLAQVPTEKQQALKGVLAHDPRPSYHSDPNRVYGLTFAGLEVKFTVCDNTLTVCKVSSL